jgi:hypothetical protein
MHYDLLQITAPQSRGYRVIYGGSSADVMIDVLIAAGASQRLTCDFIFFSIL